MKRQVFVASSLAVGLAGCNSMGKQQLTDSLRSTLALAGDLNQAVIGTRGMAREYPDSAITPVFRVNSLATPMDTRYAAALADGGRNYRLPITGLIEHPQVYTLAELRAMPNVSQTTRHDCVEGWSVVGKWGGVQLSTVLAAVQPKPEARFIVFRCFDRDDSGTEYYESLNLHQAAHPQTILALDLNGAPVPADNGGPVRMKIATQLGYKSAKWVRAIEVVASNKIFAGSQGGYWEDQGYDWYAGI
jgi:DMSO/TMAO reductase YedYZ molybdopterin-dependent catalytic subunit